MGSRRPAVLLVRLTSRRQAAGRAKKHWTTSIQSFQRPVSMGGQRPKNSRHERCMETLHAWNMLTLHLNNGPLKDGFSFTTHWFFRFHVNLPGCRLHNGVVSGNAAGNMSRPGPCAGNLPETRRVWTACRLVEQIPPVAVAQKANDSMEPENLAGGLDNFPPQPPCFFWVPCESAREQPLPLIALASL